MIGKSICARTVRPKRNRQSVGLMNVNMDM
jgi:hypothetical protein